MSAYTRQGITELWVGVAADTLPTGVAPGSRAHTLDTDTWYKTKDGTNWTALAKPATDTETETTTLNAGGGAVANATRLGKLVRWIADILNDATNGLANIVTLVQAVDTTAQKRQAGKCQIFTKAITSAANAGAVTVATVTTQPVIVESIDLHSDGATTADLTSAAVTGGAAGVIAFLSATDAAKANIDAQDEQVSWQGSVYFPAAATIIITLAGTGATAVDLNVVVKVRAAVDGGYLA